MEKLITFIVSIFLTVPVIPQIIGDKLKLSEACNLYEAPSILTNSISNLNMNDSITILQLEDEHGFYYVQYGNIKGFLNANKIVAAMKNNAPVDGKIMKKIQSIDKSFQRLVNPYIRRYGKPDEASGYYSGGYEMRTFAWNCAKGKYLSVDFILKNNIWCVESTYTHGLIQNKKDSIIEKK